MPTSSAFFSQNRHLRFEIRRLNIGHQTPFETRTQTLHQARDLLRRTVARYHDLLLRIMQFIERVKEFFLRSFFRTERLNIVDQQHIRGPVAGAQLRHSLVLDPAHDFVREAFTGGVDDPHPSTRHERASDGVHQMRLAHTDAAINEQRVVAARGVHRDRLRGRVGKLIARPNDERFERKFRIQRDRRFDFVLPVAILKTRL